MSLSNRLQCICDLIKPCDLIADIGTDHAYIPIELIKSKKVKAAIATDIVEGPLKVALENVRLEGLQDQIEVFQSDGLLRYRETLLHIDYFIIAGMGANTMIEILSEFLRMVRSMKEHECALAPRGKFLLQPMTNQYELRVWLLQNGFEILRERVAMEGSKYYNILVVSFTGEHVRTKNMPGAFDLHFGVRCEKDRAYEAYLAHAHHKHTDILENMRRSASPDMEKVRLFEELIGELELHKQKIRE